MSEVDRVPAPTLLHNMSAPPKATINHPGSRPKQRGLWFELPPATIGSERTHSPVELASRLGLGPFESAHEAERELRRRVNAHAATLPFPPACVVTSQRNLAVEEVTDFLTIITVLAKSSGHIYLRDKEPNFDRVTAGHASLALIIPNEWSPA